MTTFLDSIIMMIPEEVKPVVAFGISSVLVWHFYGGIIKAFFKNMAYNLITKKEAA